MEREPLAGRILPTALTLFGEHGYHGTSMQRIVDALDVTRAALYYHYASKQDLLRALAEPLVADFEALAQGASDDADAILAGYLDVLLAHGRVLRFVADDPAVQADTDVGVRLRRAYGRITIALADTAEGPDRDLRAACALGAVSAGVIYGCGSAQQQPLILAAAHAVLAASVSVP